MPGEGEKGLMKKINIGFIDFWPTFNPEDNLASESCRCLSVLLSELLAITADALKLIYI